MLLTVFFLIHATLHINMTKCFLLNYWKRPSW